MMIFAVTIIESEKLGLWEREKQVSVLSSHGDDLTRGTRAIQRTRRQNFPLGVQM